MVVADNFAAAVAGIAVVADANAFVAVAGHKH